MKPSFILHNDSLEILSDLTDEQAGKLFKAIADYNSGKNIDLDPMIKMVFLPFKNQFIRDNVKWEDMVEMQRQKGLKSAAVKKSKPKPTKSTGVNNGQQLPTKSTYNESDSKNDSDNESKEYKDFIKSYSDFFNDKVGVPIKMDGAEGKAAKQIINYLKTATKEKGGDLIAAWVLILDNVDMWDTFHQGQLKLSQINSNLPNILNTIRNGKPKQQIKQKGESIFRESD